MRARTTSNNRIYAGHGATFATATRICDEPASPVPHRTIADRVPVVEVMTRDVTCGRPDLSIEAVVRIITDHRIGCLPIVDEHG